MPKVLPAAKSEQLTLELSFVCTTVQTRGADGSITIRPGRVQAVPKDITTHEAAKRSGIPHRSILNLIADGKLTAYQPSGKRGGRWLVDASSLARLKFDHSNQRDDSQTADISRS